MSDIVPFDNTTGALRVLINDKRQAIADAATTDQVRQVLFSIVGLVAAAHEARDRELEAEAAVLKIKALQRLHELMLAQKETVGFNKGTAGQGRPNLGGFSDNPPKTDDRPTFAEAGIDKNLAHQARKAGAMSEEDIEAKRQAILTPPQRRHPKPVPPIEPKAASTEQQSTDKPQTTEPSTKPQTSEPTAVPPADQQGSSEPTAVVKQQGASEPAAVPPATSGTKHREARIGALRMEIAASKAEIRKLRGQNVLLENKLKETNDRLYERKLDAAADVTTAVGALTVLLNCDRFKLQDLGYLPDHIDLIELIKILRDLADEVKRAKKVEKNTATEDVEA